jgi:hypothetical protein
METKALTAVLAGFILASASGTVLAQDEQPENPTMRVVEGWTCDYNEGKGPADLKKANDAWNKWMDETGQNDYYAAIITPYFYGEQNFDFGWLGVARDGNTFGMGTHKWINEGGEVGALFNDAITCKSHTAWASMVVDPRDGDGDGDESDNDFVLSIANCSIKEGHKFEEYLAAAQEWDAYAKEVGIKSVSWAWFPIAGESNDDYGFKGVGAADDFVELGANWHKFLEGHWRKSNELFSDVVDCDVSRIYLGNAIRRWKND